VNGGEEKTASDNVKFDLLWISSHSASFSYSIIINIISSVTAKLVTL